MIVKKDCFVLRSLPLRSIDDQYFQIPSGWTLALHGPTPDLSSRWVLLTSSSLSFGVTARITSDELPTSDHGRLNKRRGTLTRQSKFRSYYPTLSHVKMSWMALLPFREDVPGLWYREIWCDHCRKCHIIEFLYSVEEPCRLSWNCLSTIALPLNEVKWHRAFIGSQSFLIVYCYIWTGIGPIWDSWDYLLRFM